MYMVSKNKNASHYKLDYTNQKINACIVILIFVYI